MKAILDDAGRIELPPSVQAQLGIKPGDEVLLEVREGQGTIVPAREHEGLSWEGNVLVHEGACRQPVDRLIGELREGRLERLSEGLPQ